MSWPRLLHDFMLGAMLGDKESEDWVLAMLGPRLGGEAGRRRGELEEPDAYELPYRPTDTDMSGLVEQPIFYPGEPLPLEDVLLSAPAVSPSPAREEEPMAAPDRPMVPESSPAVSPPREMRPPEPGPADPARWWEHETRVEKRHHWHLERGRSPEQARQLVEQERRVLESDIADPWSYLSYAATFGDQKYDEDGYVKRWDKLTGAEHVLEGWFRSQGLGKEEAQRRAAEEEYLLEAGGPKNLKSWLRHLGSLGPSMYDEEGRLKRPGTFAEEQNDLVSGVIYGSAEEMSRAQAERAVAKAMREREMMLARRGRSVGEAQAALPPGIRGGGDGLTRRERVLLRQEMEAPSTGELARGVASAAAWGLREGFGEAGGKNIAAGMVAADTVARGEGETGRWIVDFPYAYRKSLRDMNEYERQAAYEREAANPAYQHPVAAVLASVGEDVGKAGGEAGFSYATGRVTGPLLNRVLPINARSGAVDRFGRGFLGGVVGAGIKGETDPLKLVGAGLKSGSGKVAGDLTRAGLGRTSSFEPESLPYRVYTGVPAAGAKRGAKGLVGHGLGVPEDRRGAMRGLGLMEAYAAERPEQRIAEMELREAEERRRYRAHDAAMRNWFQEVGHEEAAGELLQAMTPEASRAVIRLYTDLPEEEIWQLAPDER
ncbi:MAG: hypothetical protein ACYS1C_02395 [Planctomycetota bacterium]